MTDEKKARDVRSPVKIGEASEAAAGAVPNGRPMGSEFAEGEKQHTKTWVFAVSATARTRHVWMSGTAGSCACDPSISTKSIGRKR